MSNKEHEAGVKAVAHAPAAAKIGLMVHIDGIGTVAIEQLLQDRNKAQAALITVEDSLRLANTTIEQQKRTIEELRTKGHRTDEEMGDLLDKARADARADAMKQVAKELNEAGIKHGVFFSDQGQETWHYGTKRTAFGVIDSHPAGKKVDSYTIKIDGGADSKRLAEAIARGKVNAALEGRPYLFSERNDNLLREAFVQHGQALRAELAPEQPRVNAYLTITRVGEEETITAQVDGPESAAEHIGSTLRGIAIALQHHDDCCDFGLDLPSLDKD